MKTLAPHSRVLTGLLLVAAFACGDVRPGPEPTSVDPAVVTSLVQTPAVVRGQSFFDHVTVSLEGSEPASIERGWAVRIGDVDALDIERESTESIGVLIPAGLAAGFHDVTVVAPDGRAATLVNGLEVTDEPTGLDLSVETAADGSGEVIGERTLRAGETFEAFAVARDAGAFVAVAEVTWTVEGDIGIADAGPSASTIFEAQTVGAGRLTATPSTGPSASTGTLTVIAGDATELRIEDASGGIGAEVGDLSLSTDDTLTLHAIERDAFDNFVADVAVSWSVTGSIGTLDAGPAPSTTLVLTTPGTGRVQATSGLGSDETGDLTVASGVAAVLTVAPDIVSVTTDDAPVSFTVTAADADGNPTTDLGTITWSIASGPITAIDPASGSFDPTTVGMGSVRATSSHGPSDDSGIVIVTAGRATVLTVAPNTATLSADDPVLPFTVTGVDGDGNPTTDLGTLTWSIASGPITRIDPPSGMFDPTAAGTGAVRATSSYGPSDDSGAVTVNPGRAATLTVAPSSLTTVQGAIPTPFAVTAVDADGNPTSDLGTITWSVPVGPIAAVDSMSGLFTPTASGMGAVRATSSHGPFDDAAVTVLREATLVATFTVPTGAEPGVPFVVDLRVDNTGESGAEMVSPCVLTPGGTAAVTIDSGPTPGVTIIGPGGSATFSWTVTATTEGLLDFTSCGMGVDATTMNGVASGSVTSPTISVFDVQLVSNDPFGDGSRRASVFAYDGRLSVGPSDDASATMLMQPDGSSPELYRFQFFEDTTGNSHRNSSGGPYTSIGRTGCVDDTPSCGPDNEDGRGLFGGRTIGGTEWMIHGGAKNGLEYIYMSDDTDADMNLDFRYVDMSATLDGGVRALTAMHVLSGALYLGFAHDGGERPYLVRLQTTPGGTGMDASTGQAVDLESDDLPNFVPGDPSMVDVISDFGGFVYVANAGAWHRATRPNPGRANANPAHWTEITPTDSAFTSKTSFLTAKLADIESYDRAVPFMTTYNGRLYVARNTTVGPQLWVCDPATTAPIADCDSGDWTLIARNISGDVGLSNFNNPFNYAIGLLAATSTNLYIGFHNTNGIVVFRTNVATPTTQADFTGDGGCSAIMHPATCDGLGGNGFGVATNTEIFDASTLTFALEDSVYLTTGDGVVPVRVYRMRP